MVIKRGLSSSLRATVRVIFVFGSPRIRLTASSKVMPLTGVLSKRVIKSPGFNPAL